MPSTWPSTWPAKAEVRALLLTAQRWLGDDRHGPQHVEAGSCDRCGLEPRLVAMCGPGSPPYAGRRCATELGVDGWCEGHEADAIEALAWLAKLPAAADDVAWLWWLSTGEVRLDPHLADQLSTKVREIVGT